MIFRFSQIIGVSILAIVFSLFATTSKVARSITVWQPEKGDILEIDVATNTGRLVHVSDGFSITFPVATGQKRWVYYIGRYYYAATPEQNWEVKSLDIQPDRFTFGPEGKFLRLFKNGETRTSYGIHSHKYIDNMLAQDVRYKSMGCILVSEEMMDVLEETYNANGETLEVRSYSSFVSA